MSIDNECLGIVLLEHKGYLFLAAEPTRGTRAVDFAVRTVGAAVTMNAIVDGFGLPLNNTQRAVGLGCLAAFATKASIQ